MRSLTSLLTTAALLTSSCLLPANAEAKSAKTQKNADPKSEKIVVDKSVRPAAIVKLPTLTAPGLQGKLSGVMLVASTMQNTRNTPMVLIIPGSGPTDRNGNNPAGISANSYELLALALADQGISTLRADKRGMYSSASAIADANALTIGDYASDADTWVTSMQASLKRTCIWLLGHSEGGLVALVAAQGKKNICGVILVTAPGRKLDVILREQLSSNPANAPLLPDANHALDELSAGRKIDVAAMHPALQSLFKPAVQPFLIDMFGRDPAKLSSSTNVPLLIIGGGRDIQVSRADADALAAANPKAKKVMINDMTHVLKAANTDGLAASIATYSNRNLPIHPELVKTITAFVNDGGK